MLHPHLIFAGLSDGSIQLWSAPSHHALSPSSFIFTASICPPDQMPIICMDMGLFHLPATMQRGAGAANGAGGAGTTAPAAATGAAAHSDVHAARVHANQDVAIAQGHRHGQDGCNGNDALLRLVVTAGKPLGSVFAWVSGPLTSECVPVIDSVVDPQAGAQASISESMALSSQARCRLGLEKAASVSRCCLHSSLCGSFSTSGVALMLHAGVPHVIVSGMNGTISKWQIGPVSIEDLTAGNIASTSGNAKAQQAQSGQDVCTAGHDIYPMHRELLGLKLLPSPQQPVPLLQRSVATLGGTTTPASILPAAAVDASAMDLDGVLDGTAEEDGGMVIKPEASADAAMGPEPGAMHLGARSGPLTVGNAAAAAGSAALGGSAVAAVHLPQPSKPCYGLALSGNGLVAAVVQTNGRSDTDAAGKVCVKPSMTTP